MIIVAGHFHVATADRDTVMSQSREAIQLARSTPGCEDYAISPDPVDPERVNVYERWTDRTTLDAFRGDGPDDELNALIFSAQVAEFEARPMH